MKKFYKNGIFLVTVILFSISLVLTPLNAYAEEINVKSVGVDKTTIIMITNDSTKEVKTFRIWLGQNANFESFKTEKGWIGEKNTQGVIIFSSSETIKENQSVKFGIKTDKSNPVINWKGFDKTNTVLDTGVISTTKIEKVNQNPTIDSEEQKIDKNGEIFSDSIFRIIPDKPNVGSTIRVTGENFGASQIFDFYIDTQKIGSFQTDNKGDFITTMKIPENGVQDRVNFKIKNNQGEEKIISLRIGEGFNRIAGTDDTKITIDGIENIVNRGDRLELFGTASSGSTMIIEIKDSEQNTLNSRTTKVDNTGNWKIESPVNIPFDMKFGKYTITVSDGKNQILKYIQIETDKIVLLNPTEAMFDPGQIIKFNGTALPNQLLELVLEDNFGKEVISDIITVDNTGFVEFEYQTKENDDEEGTWTLIATQNGIKEFTYVGYGELPTTPINIEFDKMNYKMSEKAIISFLGKPSANLKVMIINPSGSISSDEFMIQLQEDGRGTYELELTNYVSGIYTAVIQKGNSQSSEKFAVGLQLATTAIDAKVTQTEYTQGEQILLLGATNSNVLLNVVLINPNGIEIKNVQIPSKNDGTFKVDNLKIPSNAALGLWKINVFSGSMVDKIQFEVISKNEGGIVINVGDIIDIPGFGESIKIGIMTSQKTTISMQVLDNKNNQIGETLSCNPTAEFKCEILWTIPKEIIPGTYTIQVSDSLITANKDIQIK
tara:strand:+ start:550 stop:2706 length:2157 start_codon:yes stop_codon:yes gene_type:complete